MFLFFLHSTLHLEFLCGMRWPSNFTLFFQLSLFQSLLLTNPHCSHSFLTPPFQHTLRFVSRSSILLHWPANNFLPVPHNSNYCNFIISDISFKSPFEEPMPKTWLRYTWPRKLAMSTALVAFLTMPCWELQSARLRATQNGQCPGDGQRVRADNGCIHCKGH